MSLPAIRLASYGETTSLATGATLAKEELQWAVAVLVVDTILQREISVKSVVDPSATNRSQLYRVR